jgi:hypothetical protein
MVRNLTGGNNNKKFARKHASGNVNKSSMKLRISEDEGELYAVTTKNLGNNMFHAIDLSGTTYLVHIRGKFSGRGRRDNTIAAGVWVLIGLREWSNSTPDKNGKAKLQQCDLLEVYTEMDKNRLKDSVNENWQVLEENDPTRINKDDRNLDDEINWQTDKEAEKERLLAEINSGTAAKINLTDTTDERSPQNTNTKTEWEVFIDEI